MSIGFVAAIVLAASVTGATPEIGPRVEIAPALLVLAVLRGVRQPDGREIARPAPAPRSDEPGPVRHHRPRCPDGRAGLACRWRNLPHTGIQAR